MAESDNIMLSYNSSKTEALVLELTGPLQILFSELGSATKYLSFGDLPVNSPVSTIYAPFIPT